MRNIAHMKKFVEPATIEIGASKGPEQPELPEQVVEPVQCDQPEAAASQSSLQPQEVLLSKSPRSSDTSRPARIRHKPAWMKDFVCNYSTLKKKKGGGGGGEETLLTLFLLLALLFMLVL